MSQYGITLNPRQLVNRWFESYEQFPFIAGGATLGDKSYIRDAQHGDIILPDEN